MCSIPGMVVMQTADAVEARAMVEAAINYVGPCYMRFGRYAVPTLFDKDTYKFEIGKGVVMADGKDITIIAAGLMVEQALLAREQLAAENITARVVNIHTIKPLDSDLILKCAADTGAIVTAEEHNYIGGLGSAVCECVSGAKPIPVIRVGVEDQFGRSGKVPPLMELYGLTAANIVAKAKAAIAMK